MIDSVVERIQIGEVKTDSKYFVMVRVLGGYEADAETRADIITEIKDAFEALGCPRANIAVVIMRGLELA